MRSIQRLLRKRRRRIVGLMSGTSADGVDAALIDVEVLSQPIQGKDLTWELVDFLSVPFEPAVREEILRVQRDTDRVLERVTRLHFILGHLYADAVEKIVEEAGTPMATVDAVASHGQTLCHFPRFPEAPSPREGAGAASWQELDTTGGWRSASTLQIGEPAVLAARTGKPVIHNFRSADVAAGGTGAPLVPLIDHLIFGDPERSRLILNVGGIANMTALRKGAGLEDVLAFDTGPGNMVIDGLMTRVSGGARHLDEGGALARKGAPDRELVDAMLGDPYFTKAPPKAAGREQFGDDFIDGLWERCRQRKLTEAQTLATATSLTARAIHDAYVRFVRGGFEAAEVVVSGGGAHNVTLLEYLSDLFEGASVVPSDYYGLDVDAKEAVAFALLGQLTLESRPGNVPSVTGAAHPVVLGCITPGAEDL